MKLKYFLFTKFVALTVLIFSSFDFAWADLADDEAKEATPPPTNQSAVKTPGETSSGQNLKTEKKSNKNQASSFSDREDSKSDPQKNNPPEIQKNVPKEPQKPDLITPKSTQPTTGQNRDSKSSRNQKNKRSVSGPPVKFRADSMSGNRFQGEVSLKGNVTITQGDLLIRGDEANIEQDPKLGNLIKVSVDGKVYLEKIDETTGKKITASAKSAIYSAPNRNITFKGNASITRGTDRMNGNIINYNLSTGLIKAEKVDGMIQQND